MFEEPRPGQVSRIGEQRDVGNDSWDRNCVKVGIFFGLARLLSIYCSRDMVFYVVLAKVKIERTGT